MLTLLGNFFEGCERRVEQGLTQSSKLRAIVVAGRVATTGDNIYQRGRAGFGRLRQQDYSD